MKVVKKRLDFWPRPTGNNIYLFTGNSYITANGALVMGRGAALQVRSRYPGIDVEFGDRIEHLSTYGIVVIPKYNIGVFQVKDHFSKAARPDLIAYSAAVLHNWLLVEERREFQVHMNFPGIGNGKLEKRQVMPLIEDLPSNVTVYEI